MLNTANKVKVKDAHGDIVEGELLQQMDDQYSNFWWVKYVVNGHTEVSLFPEEDLVHWNSGREELKHCVCGTLSVKGNKHSIYCNYDK